MAVLLNNTYNHVFLKTPEPFQKFEMSTLSKLVAHGRGDADACDGVELSLDEIGPGTVFFDIDSAWNAPCRRSALYPAIKANGTKIAVYVYDIIPITYPQYCHGNTIVKFGHYIGATLEYADRIIVSTRHTLDEIAALCTELGIPEMPGSVSWLGADFKAKATGNDEMEAEVRQKYHGRLKAKFLTDSMLLAGDKLPHDPKLRVMAN